VVVPHGAEHLPLPPSPAEGPLLFAATMAYPPNRAAARWLVEEVWPEVRSREPALRLGLVGRLAGPALGWARGREGVDVVSDPDDVEEHYRRAALVLAPVTWGGGAQLKVVAALARARVVVATSFSARSAPDRARVGVVVADDAAAFAAAALRLWRDRSDRWARERALAERAGVPTWAEAGGPLVEALARLSRSVGA
jgi:succinoglycan biosynthesis protein ExoO